MVVLVCRVGGNSGGLCIFWKEDINLSLVSYSHHHIYGDILRDGEVSWRFVGIYGWAKSEEKHLTWHLIRSLYESSNSPILFGGDFDELLSMEEKEGGRDMIRKEVANFREVVDLCKLCDLGYKGMWYTWVRGLTEDTRVRERLDRFLGSTAWCALYSSFEVCHLMRYKSDHTPILLKGSRDGRRTRRKKRGFKFETCWLLEEGCKDVVREAWGAADTRGIMERMASVTKQLVVWSGDKFNQLGKKIKDTERALTLAQQQPISNDSCTECTRLESVLEDLHEKDEAYWYIRLRITEVNEGDRYLKYFHHKAPQQRKRNEIKGLFTEEEWWKSNENELEEIFSKHFTDLFGTTSPNDTVIASVLECVQPRISEAMNDKSM